MNRFPRHLIFYSIGGLMAVVISYFVLFPHVWRCQWIEFSDFKKITSTFYISPDTPPKNLQKAQSAMADAHKRISRLWGTPQQRATFILCENTEQYRHYCNSTEGAGCSLGTPWGQSFIVLNVEGLNTDVIAHEMCHAELFTRLGWWKTTRQIPQWFNEGLALMVDYRFVPQTDSIQRHRSYKEECLYLSRGGQIALDLKDISSMRGFFNGNESHVMLAYMTGATEVSRWLAAVGEAKVQILIQQVAAGKPFEVVYKDLEQTSRIRP
ncbi:hypothetical protein [Runella zeae]|jgi:hypothetical protein|uniref:hypothetical protein n=1 Tax=Runella zeae TaxID=94255 RepID=UPI00048BB955|nr:hypothetical protein [Runella zeae]